MKTKINIEQIAEKLGEEVTKKGNIQLGADDQGYHEAPGGGIAFLAVAYYLRPTGDVSAVIDTRHGRNQGYFEGIGGGVVRLEEEDLEAAIAAGESYIDDMEDEDQAAIKRAWRIASSAARAMMQRIKDLDLPDHSPLGGISTEELREELARREAE